LTAVRRQPGFLERSAAAALDRLERYCRAEDYQGWDPFDGLNSKLFNSLPLSHNRILQLAWLQTFKRSPINLRPAAHVPRCENAKALALFAMGYGLLGHTDRQSALLDRMVRLRDAAAGAWGYPFPWRARAFYVPAMSPNVVATAYAVQALAGAAVEAPVRTPAILAAADFVEKELVRRDAHQRLYIAYVQTSDAVVHNANLWGAYILAEACQRGGPDRWQGLASTAVEYTLAQQQRDGSWSYGGRGHHRFIDSFHTGYNICALARLAALRSSSAVDEAIRRALDFYAAKFFSPDGCPAYYVDRRWPIDAHSGAQAIITLLTVRPDESRTRLAARVLGWLMEKMWLPEKGRFAYQRTLLGLNTVPYMRWTQAWMFLALATWAAQAPGAGAGPVIESPAS
jgi:polysaccharide biosynthesis protein VpsJ